MKNHLILPLLLILASTMARAQVLIDFDSFTQHQNVTLMLRLLDSKTKEPVNYATVYLIPQGDTTITHFAVSDAKGKVKIEDIIPGKYEVNAELIGYKPYMEVHDLNGWQKDLGAILMEENAEFIDAASITALGNPVTVVKDTVIYNASAFHVGENAMLEDLLKKMPGMEVDEDGTVKVNGEPVDKITVGGKTFFFNDPSMALKNLPAKIVDKIKVIDKDKDDAEFSGVSTRSEKEKVMDVELKEEYKKGWFGNAKILGGSTLGGDNELLDDIGALFNASGMVAGYNDRDQITILGSAHNANAPGSDMAMVIMDDATIDELTSKPGQVTSGQIGANYNTDRVKGMDFNASVNYDFSDKDAREKSMRTAFQPDGSEIITNANFNGLGSDRKINTSLELKKKDTGKYMVGFRPSFKYISRDRTLTNASNTEGSAGMMNESNSEIISHSDILSTDGYYNFGIKDIGKKRRSLALSGSYRFRNTLGNSLESSRTSMAAGIDIRNLSYDNHERYFAGESVLKYVEPISENWALQARFTACHVSSNTNKDAFNVSDGSVNDYYTSWSVNKDLLFRERLLAQFEKDETSLVFGAMVDEENNVTHARTVGIESSSGEREWIVNWSPYAELEWNTDKMNLGLYYMGNSNTPSGTSILPALNISNPVYISTGNIYLRPSFSQQIYLSMNGSIPEKYIFYQLWANASFTDMATTYASWFDKDGIRYSIPVNSLKPGSNYSLSLSFNTPLDKKKHFQFSTYSYARIASNTNYQATGIREGFDKDHFDYASMMASFWGNDASGDMFYSGKSGFSESRTTTTSWACNAKLKYTGDKLSAGINSYFVNNVSKYSLDPTANMNSWEIDFGGEVLYQPGKGFELQTEADYTFYRGYSTGFGDPSLIWDAKICKSVKSLVFSLGCTDILGQRRSLARTASAEYFQDTYSNVMGRYIMLGVTFNFGKMNAKNNNAVQDAMWNMLF